MLPGDLHPLTNAADIAEQLKGRIEVVLDGGNCGIRPTTVVDLAGEAPQILRQGRGSPQPFR